MSRKKVKEMRTQENMFIGMEQNPDPSNSLLDKSAAITSRAKIVQANNAQEFQAAMVQEKKM